MITIKQTFKLTLLSTVIATSLGSTNIALAQEADNETRQLERIIVTSQKRTQSLKEVPLSVSAMNSEKIEEAGIERLEDLAFYIPNLSINKSPIGDSINIRGMQSGNQAGFEQSVGTFLNGIYRGRGTQSRFAFADLERVEVLRGPQSILFGKNTVAGAINLTSARPDEDFNGRVGISYNFDHEQTDIEAMVTGSLSDSLRGRLFVLDRQMDKGWIENVYGGNSEPMVTSDETMMRATLEWDATSDTMITAIYEYSDFDNGIPFSMLEPGSLAGAGAIKNGYSQANIGNQGVFDPGRPGGVIFGDNTEITLISETNFQEGSLTIVAGKSTYEYDRYHDVDYSPLNALRFDDTEDFSQNSLEIRYASNTENKLEYITGLYWQNQDLIADGYSYFNVPFLQGLLAGSCNSGVTAMGGDFDTLFQAGNVGATTGGIIGTVPGVPASLINACGTAAAFAGAPAVGRYALLGQETDTLGVFAQATYKFTDDFRATFGMRYTTEEKSAFHDVYATEVRSSRDLTATTSPLVTGIAQAVGEFVTHSFTPSDEGMSRKENSPTYLINAQYDVSNEMMTYVTYSTGFKAGGFNSFYMSSLGANGTPVANSEDVSFGDESASSFELGMKTTLLGGAADLNVAVFHSTFEDMQVSIFSGNTTFVVQNAAEASSQGIEIEGRWLATDSLTLSGSMALLDFTYDNFPNQACTSAQFVAARQGLFASAVNAGNVPGAIGAAMSYNNAQCSAAQTNDLTGRTNEHSPDTRISLVASHFAELGQFELTSAVDVNYTSEAFRSADLDPIGQSDAVAIVNASMTLQPIDGNWNVALNVKNLTDAELFTFANDVPLFAGSIDFFPQPGTNWTLSFNYMFGD